MAFLLTKTPVFGHGAGMKPLTTAFVFPGQGSQVPGMAADFLNHPAARELAESFDDALGLGLTKLMVEGDEAALKPTEVAQPALLAAGLLAYAYIRAQSGKTLPELAGFVAGHSLGEYTAVAAAGGYSPQHGIKLVRARGLAMAKAGTGKDGGPLGGMLAVLGLEPAKAAEVADASGLVLANDNSPVQQILSGPLEALHTGEKEAAAAGAKRVVRLNVSGPFHTVAMQPAAGEVEARLAEIGVKPLLVPCAMNATAGLHTAADEVSANLIAQITSTVRWRESMALLAEQGVTQVVELGVGKVLAGLVSRCDARLTGTALDTRQAVDAWLEAVSA